jgi:hypothetical protein
MSFLNRSGSFMGATLPIFFRDQQPAEKPNEEKSSKWDEIYRRLGIDKRINKAGLTKGTGAMSSSETGVSVNTVLEQDAPQDSQVKEELGNDRLWALHPIKPSELSWRAGLSAMHQPCMDPLPEGWTMYIHPEGKPYYHKDAREPEVDLLGGVSRNSTHLQLGFSQMILRHFSTIKESLFVDLFPLLQTMIRETQSRGRRSSMPILSPESELPKTNWNSQITLNCSLSFILSGMETYILMLAIILPIMITRLFSGLHQSPWTILR